jgi:enterochelin esterase-like enzyme
MTEVKSPGILVENMVLESIYLEREVKVDFYLPTHVAKPAEMSLLLINDGQDLPKMPFEEILDELYTDKLIEPLLCVGIHCGPDRKNEYGTAKELDYKGRGAKAKDYTHFVFSELLPFIRKTYLVPSFKEKSFAGFSLGALSAMDIAWNYPQQFTKVGLFSASLWWRSKGYDEGYNDDTDKIMHAQVREGKHYPWMKFFFQCGAADESADRNDNGVIDSIDDTLDMIKELKAVGYTNDDIKYLELPDGKHDVPTWGKAFPEFLKWGWGRNK